MATPRSLTLLVIGVAVLVIQARFIVGGQTWDDARYHAEVAPVRIAAAEAVQAGELPAWWDGSGLGIPLAGEPSHGALYPPIWLGASPRALDWVMIIHLLWAALGAALWARRLGASEPAAVVAGVLASATGLLTGAALRGALPALAHLPWVGWAACGLAAAADRRARRRAAAGIGALIGAIGLAGQLGVLIDALVLALALGARRSTRGALAVGVAGGLAIAAAQLVPAISVIAAGAGAQVHGLPLARLIELIVPGSFGSPDGSRAIAAIAGAAPWAPSLFVGAPVLALALVRRAGARPVAIAVAFAVLALVVGRGGWPAWLGAPELHLGALALLAAAHAGPGVDALGDGVRRALIALAVAAGLTAVALAAVGALGEPAAHHALVPGALGVAAMGAAVVLAWRDTLRPLLLALVLVPVVGATPSVAPAIDRTTVEDPPMWARAAAATPEPRRLYQPTGAPELAVDTETAIATLAGESPARWGIAAARSEDPARPALHDRVWLAAANAGGELLSRFGIGLAILPLPATGYHQLAHRRGWALVRYPALPPASVELDWQWAATADAAAAKVFAPRRPPGIVLEGSGAPSEEGGAPSPCAIAAWDDGAIDLRCTAPEPAYAAVSSTAAEGWSVTVDGHAAPWVAADVLRRAVAISAGDHQVRWRYRAPGLAVGLVVAAAGALVLLGLTLAGRRDRASRATT